MSFQFVTPPHISFPLLSVLFPPLDDPAPRCCAQPSPMAVLNQTQKFLVSTTRSLKPPTPSRCCFFPQSHLRLVRNHCTVPHNTILNPPHPQKSHCAKNRIPTQSSLLPLSLVHLLLFSYYVFLIYSISFFVLISSSCHHPLNCTQRVYRIPELSSGFYESAFPFVRVVLSLLFVAERHNENSTCVRMENAAFARQNATSGASQSGLRSSTSLPIQRKQLDGGNLPQVWRELQFFLPWRFRPYGKCVSPLHRSVDRQVAKFNHR